MQDENTHPEDLSQDFFEIELPEISDVPPAIEGRNGDGHTNSVAILIARSTPDFDQAWEWMLRWNKICKPVWPEYRLKQKLESAWNYAHPNEFIIIPEEEINRPRARKRKVSFKRLNEFASQAKGKYDELLSAIKDKEIPPLEELIDQMYPGNPLICRATGSWKHAMTDTRESFRGVEKEMEWIVPSPMSKMTGVTKGGRDGSRRCRDNAGPWRYMVIEFDFTVEFKEHIDAWAAAGISTRDVQARLILWLAVEGECRQWPFMIVDSGKKSLHSWYAIHRNFPEWAAMDLLSRAIPLGADKHADQPEQFFRFPGGTRKSDKGQSQPVIFYDRTKLV